MTNVVIARPRSIKVSTNETSGLISSTTPITIKETSSIKGITRLDSLEDVVATEETQNATLVYQEETDSYVVKQIDLDGGTF